MPLRMTDDPVMIEKARGRICYVSGPMRGYDQFNFPAFDKARDWLEKNGWLVYSPADLDREGGFDPKGDGYDFNVEEALRRDFTVICRSGAIVLLPGWEKSEGANHELRVAKAIGLRVYELDFTGEGDPYWLRDLEEELPHAIRPGEVVVEHGKPLIHDYISNETHYISNKTPAQAFTRAANELLDREEEGKPFGVPSLPSEAAARKTYPIATGVVDYFPDALVEVAHVSRVGNDQHNPGKPLFWDRTKSQDEADALMRHFIERGTRDADGLRHSAKVAWRALALLQKEIEQS